MSVLSSQLSITRKNNLVPDYSTVIVSLWMFYSWRRKSYKQVTSVLTLNQSTNEMLVMRHETDTLPMIGNTKSTAGLQNKPLQSTLLGIRRYTKLWLGVRPQGQIYKEDINQTSFLKLTCQMTRQWVRKYLWKHINTEKKASTRACRCQPVTDVLPALTVRPNPCPQPSLGTWLSPPGCKAGELPRTAYITGEYPRTHTTDQAEDSGRLESRNLRKHTLKTFPRNYIKPLLLFIKYTQYWTTAKYKEFIASLCNLFQHYTIIIDRNSRTVSYLQGKRALSIGYRQFNFNEAVERVLASCPAHHGEGMSYQKPSSLDDKK